MIGQYIASRRKELRVSQKDLAEKLNVTAGAVSQWEHGRTMPDITMYPKIADALNTTVAALFGEEQKEPAVESDLHAAAHSLLDQMPEQAIRDIIQFMEFKKSQNK